MSARVATVLTGLVLGGAALALPAAAQQSTAVAVTVEQDTRERLDIPLQAPLRATVTEGGTPPSREFAVFASAENTASAERTQVFECTPELDPKVPPGVYLCTVYVIRGGTWTFTVFVNELSADPRVPPVTLARGTLDFEVVSDVVSEERVAPAVDGRATDVLALWVHVVAATVWFACVVLLVFLAVPWARARLSPATVAALERRFDTLPKGTWAAAVCVVGTGVYLMLNQTAYETPWSPDAIDQRFILPYARPYFLSLAVKLAAYAAMLGVTPALISEARRRSQLETAPKSAAWWVRGSAVLIAAGAPLITFCVTLLKYFHELIEASGAT